MLNKSIARSLAVLGLFSVLLIFGSEADARSVVPIFADDFVASAEVDGAVWVAPAAHAAALEDYLGQPVAVGPLSSVIADLAPAAAGGSLRFEGCCGAPAVELDLAGKGYVTEMSVAPALLVSDGASIWTD